MTADVVISLLVSIVLCLVLLVAIAYFGPGLVVTVCGGVR